MAPLGRLGVDPNAPFRFALGERVSWLNQNNIPSEEFRGEIVDGWSRYDASGGAMTEIYTVRRENGLCFDADGIRLKRLG
jgi:hypothetical protein